jgi:8-oxo-dGTP diphosphatase
MPYTYQFPRPSVTVDCVVFGIGEGSNGRPVLEVLLVERGDVKEPFYGFLALPGGFLHVSDDGDQGEDLEECGRRELKEETDADIEYMEQLCTVGTPKRDPRGRVITVVYFALVRSKDHAVRGGDDAKAAHWNSMQELLTPRTVLAFDHVKTLRMAYERLRAKVRYAPIGFHLLPAKFTLTDLQRVYEAILMRPLDKRNFRKRILAMGILVDCGQAPAGRTGPTPTLYRFDKRAYDHAVRDGFNFEV